MNSERYSVREERRSRKQLSCAECHRLKLKCDRQVPCSNCVRRECAELCPNSVRVKNRRGEAGDGKIVAELRDRLAAIEGLLEGLGPAAAGHSRSRTRSRSASVSRSPSPRDVSSAAGPSYRRERDRHHQRERDRDRERERYGNGDRRESATTVRGRDPARDRETHPRDARDARVRDAPREQDRDLPESRDRDRGDRDRDQDRDWLRSRTDDTRRRYHPFEAELERSRSPFRRTERAERGKERKGAHASSHAHGHSLSHGDRRTNTTLPSPQAQTHISPEARRDGRARGASRVDERPGTAASMGAGTGAGGSASAFRGDGDRDGDRGERERGDRDFDVRFPAAEESYGTLMIDPGGRSKWLGPTAGTEWLKNQEIPDDNERSRSRSPSPRGPYDFAESLFPFPAWGPSPSLETIALHLPPPESAQVLIDAYYGNYAWNHDVAPRRAVQPLLERVYAPGDERPARRVHPQQLALLFIIMAMGALHNPALPPHDPSAELHCAAARWCLVKGDFIGHNTIAGLQAVVIMAHYQLETEKGRNGDNAWPLWGLAMRLVTAMGLHRDGARWNLPVDVVEERRHVFWECHTIDVFQANCFSRPSSLRPEHIDTKHPSQGWDGSGELTSFRTLKFELCRISGAVLDQAMDVRPTQYATITALYDRLCAFERQIPFHLRCRAALLALPSVYPDSDAAMRDSPAVHRGDLRRTFQQFTLALNVSECILFLQRPYFVKALQEAPQDPTRSTYGRSYLAVVERCNVLIEVVAGLYDLYPTVTARHWFFWYHLFTAAVCVGTMIIKNAANPLADFALGQIDHSIRLYSAVLRDHATPSLLQNHQWLLRLRQRALHKIEHEAQARRRGRRRRARRRAGSNESGDDADADGDADVDAEADDADDGVSEGGSDGADDDADEDDRIDIELLGWRTRLVERARPAPSPVLVPPLSKSPAGTAPAAPIEQVLQQHFAVPPVGGSRPSMELSTDLFLHQFWDPTTLLDVRDGAMAGLTGANWWNFDPELMENMMHQQQQQQ